MNFYVEYQTPEVSEMLQKIAFQNGHAWYTSRDEVIKNTEKKFLCFYGDESPKVIIHRNHAPSDKSKLSIEEAIKELTKRKEEYKVGDFVKTENIRFRISKINGNEVYSDDYYMDFQGKILPNERLYACDYGDIIGHLTKEEIKEYLIAEAEKRGFKVGVKFKSVKGTVGYLRNGIFLDTMNPENYALVDNSPESGNYILCNNEWAEIIDEFKINGYAMEIKKDVIKFGCAEISKECFLGVVYPIIDFNKSSFGNRKIKSIKLSSDVEIKVEEMEELIKRMEK